MAAAQAHRVLAALVPRQTVVDVPPGFVAEDGRYVPFWYTKTGEIVKWSIFLGFIVLFTGFLTIGYWHAKRRMRKGLVPLGYHRWLITRAELARVDPRYAFPQATYTNYRPANDVYGMYAMPPMPPPPPMYDPNAMRPPLYDAPSGPAPPPATKVDPSQWRAEPTRRPAAEGGGGDAPTTGSVHDEGVTFAPPPGPPPPAASGGGVARNTTGASESSNNPFLARR